jgi:DeoR/GlpR family transcriptional regulator of sugar metabolism
MSQSASTPQLAVQRQEAIMEMVRRDGAVRASELVERLGVSDMTVRRDIAALAGRGLVMRVHGGAVLPMSSTDEPAFTAKSKLRVGAKAAIADEAASLVRPGDAVAISSGSTALEVARRLAQVPHITIVTNSIPATSLLSSLARDDLTLIVTGGERTPSEALAGPIAEGALGSLHTDWLFLGVHGITADGKLTTPNSAEARTSRALMQAAARSVVVADSTKWGVAGMWTIAPLSEVDAWITDTDLPRDATQAAEEWTGTVKRVAPVRR